MKKKSKLAIAIEKGRKAYPNNTLKGCIHAIRSMDVEAFRELREEAERKWKDFDIDLSDLPKTSKAKKK